MRRPAFTLIEVMVVVAIIGLLAVATTWSLADDVKRSSRADVISQIVHADRSARLAAYRFGKPCVLRFDLDQQNVRRYEGEKRDHTPAARTVNFPARQRIARLIVQASGDGVVASNSESGAVEVAYSTAGRSPSYAVQLEGGDSEGESWVFFAGLTGQATRVQSEDKINNLFSILASGRVDAD